MATSTRGGRSGPGAGGGRAHGRVVAQVTADGEGGPAAAGAGEADRQEASVWAAIVGAVVAAAWDHPRQMALDHVTHGG